MLFLCWKTQELSGASPLDPHLTPLGPFIGLLDPTPQGWHALPFPIFLFLINGAPNHPLSTGTLKQSYATASSSSSSSSTSSSSSAIWKVIEQ